MLSIDDDDGTTEYDPHEHAESLRHGIPDHFGTNQCCDMLVKFFIDLQTKDGVFITS